MTAYRYDPQEEPATMLVRVHPHRYVSIATSLDPKVDGKMYYPVAGEVLKDNGKVVREWMYEETADVWVPPRIGNILIKSADTTNPIGRMIMTRTEEEALAGEDPRKEKKRPRRRRAKRTASEDTDTDDE